MIFKKFFLLFILSLFFLLAGKTYSQWYQWYDNVNCPTRSCNGIEWTLTQSGSISDFEIPGTGGKCWMHLQVWKREGLCPDGTR
ncbi:MAG: hypothetical protein QG635_1342, partial [Bacteroidota bacterium]|nr:hypothetical protein [Bacteroidota bacterium]